MFVIGIEIGSDREGGFVIETEVQNGIETETEEVEMGEIGVRGTVRGIGREGRVESLLGMCGVRIDRMG